MSKGRQAPTYPNTAKERRKHGKYEDLISAQDLGENFEPNRAQRRDYVRINQTRQIRKNLVGFGRWRRHIDRADYPITPRENVDLPLRRDRRPAMIRFSKIMRRIVRAAERTRP